MIFRSPVVVDSPVGVEVRARARNVISGKQGKTDAPLNQVEFSRICPMHLVQSYSKTHPEVELMCRTNSRMIVETHIASARNGLKEMSCTAEVELLVQGKIMWKTVLALIYQSRQVVTTRC